MANKKKKRWWSHSKLNVARDCLKKFKYKYIDKIEVEEDRTAAHFGEIMHTVAEKYNGEGKDVLLACYHDAIKDCGPIVNEEYRKRIPLALKNIHVAWAKHLKGVLKKNRRLEDNIKVSLNEDIIVNGKIDVTVIDDKNGRIRVIDYKTSKSKKYGDHTDQLAMYMLLLHLKHHIPYEDMDCEIVYLCLQPEEKDGTPVANEGSENICKEYKVLLEDVGILVEEIEAINHKIDVALKTDKWTARPSWFKCTYCPFSEMCEDRYVDEENK